MQIEIISANDIEIIERIAIQCEQTYYCFGIALQSLGVREVKENQHKKKNVSQRADNNAEIESSLDEITKKVALYI